MKILFLTFYYKPDLCAGSFRSTALVEQLKKYSGVSVDVITTLPNRYSSFSVQADEVEIDGQVSILRIPLPVHNSGMLDQARAFLYFAAGAYRYARDKDYDLVFATSSRLLTAFLGAALSVSKKKPLYLDIRDIFVDTIGDVMSKKVAFCLVPMLRLIEKFTIRRANRVNFVSKGFQEYFFQRYPAIDARWFTNGIDEVFLAKAPEMPYVSGDAIKTIVYAGNLGEGQGLHKVIPELANSLKGKARFIIFGDGGRKPQLMKRLLELGVTNVDVNPPVDRDELIKQYQNADVLFLHLNDYQAFEKVLPSKIFEYATLGKPIFAGVSGYSSRFLRENVSNSVVFQPGDWIMAAKLFETIEFLTAPRPEFIAQYARTKIMQLMAEDIVELGADKE